MGVKRIMETFFAGMQDQSMSGFGGRIVNTPMGPFRWNDTMQLWENVNNGMVMNNISFQDSMMMMDYASYDGGSAPITTTVINVPNSFLSINFAGATLGSIFGVIRNSSSYEVETNNILTEIGTNTPKYILGSNYSNKGILVEKGATNYLLYSNSFTNNIPVVNGGWTGINSTMVVDNSVSNPDDTVGAMKLTATAKTFVAGARSGMTASGITANQYWAFSAWIKAGSVSTASLYVLGVADLVNYNGQIGIPCNVKILSGPGVVVPSPNKDELHWKAIENLSTTEWTNVEWTCSSPIEDAYLANGGSQSNFKFIAPNIYISTYKGDGVQRVEIGDSIYIWGAQYENGPYSTSLIKTENAITFRQPDRVLDNNIQNDWLNGVCGSFVVEFDRRNDNYGTEGSFVRTVIATGITANKHIYVGYTSGSTYGIFGWFNGATLIPGLVQGNNKFAFSYLRGETGQITASLNGNNATVYTIGNISELGCGTNWLTIGARVAYTGTAFVNAASLTGFTDTTVKSLKYWNYPLTAAELKQAST